MAEQEGNWIAVWAASPQGPYPAGNPSAQPVLSFAIPDPAAGLAGQSARMILCPSVWGRALRIRFTNVFGAAPLVMAHARVALAAGGGGVLGGSTVPLVFDGRDETTIPPGESRWCDPVAPGFLASVQAGQKLAVSFHLPRPTGPMTWHAKALQTSYLAAPGARLTDDETGLGFPFSTTSWFFIDAVDMVVPGGRTIAAFGDSLTDGTFSTLNGDDRWPDFLARRLRAAGHDRVAIVNAGIGGNQIVGPASYDLAAPVAGGPSALDRLDRDVLALSGLAAVIWLEGTNDSSLNGCGDPDAIVGGLRRGVARMRAARPGLRILGGTIPGAVGSGVLGHGGAAQDRCRRALNSAIRRGDLFDAVIDFEAATTNLATGQLLAPFVPDSTLGGPGDGLHPNRAGYAAMAACIDLKSLGF